MLRLEACLHLRFGTIRSSGCIFLVFVRRCGVGFERIQFSVLPSDVT